MAQLKLRILLHLVFVKTLFIQTNEQEHTVKASNDPIKAERGSDVILPCHLEPPFDVSRMLVEWKRGSETVHLSRRGHDFPEEQDPWFKNRTQLFHQEMKHGNISLKLFKVTKEDKGTYTCFVSKLQSQVRKGLVTLIIEDPGIKEERKEEPENEDNKSGNAGIVLWVFLCLICLVGGIALGVFLERKKLIEKCFNWIKCRRGHQQKADQPSSSEPLRQNRTNPVNEKVPLNNFSADQPTNQQQPPVHEEVQPVNEEVPLNNINDVMSEE